MSEVAIDRPAWDKLLFSIGQFREEQGGGVVLAVFGAWNDLFCLPGEPREFRKKLCRLAHRAALRLNAH